MKLSPSIYKGRLTPYVLLLLLVCPPSYAATAIPPTLIKFGVMEEQSDKVNPDPNASYNRVLDAALYYAVGESAERLAGCGYRVEVLPSYFDWEDKLSPKERAQELERAGAWIIFGPEPSYSYLVARKGLKSTAMVSPMAGARAVTDLKAPFFTMYPTIDKLAGAAVRGATGLKYGKRYGVLVDASCPSCKDFADSFTTLSKDNYRQEFWVDVVGDAPDLSRLMAALTANKIDFLLAPNYEVLSAYVIQKVHEKFPNVKFVGADSWGDDQVSNMKKYNLSSTVRGVHVRGGRSAEEMRNHYGLYSLHRSHEGKAVLPHYSAYMMVDLVRTLVNHLCKTRPKAKADFLESLKKLSSDHFKSKIGVGVFSLEGGKADFLYAVAE